MSWLTDFIAGGKGQAAGEAQRLFEERMGLNKELYEKMSADNLFSRRQLLEGQGELLGHQRSSIRATREAYQSSLDYTKGRVGRVMGELEGVGDSARRDILDREKTAMGSTTSGLNARGLGNTTIVDSARRGIRTGTDRSLNSLAEGLGSLRATFRSGLEGDVAASITAKRDAVGRAQDTWAQTKQTAIQNRYGANQATIGIDQWWTENRTRWLQEMMAPAVGSKGMGNPGLGGWLDIGSSLLGFLK